MRFIRRRDAFLLTKGKIYRMSQERQKVSFFIVVIFLAIFGMIVLAEVLFIQDGKGSDLFYEDEDNNNEDGGKDDANVVVVDGWETPKPLTDGLGGGGGLEANERNKAAARLGLSLKKHQEEMERLIRNISASLRNKPPKLPPAVSRKNSPDNRAKNISSSSSSSTLEHHRNFFEDDEANSNSSSLPNFDFQLRDHFGFDGMWQPVNGVSHKFYVYSAYLDLRDDKNPVVRVIGVTRTKRSNPVTCRMYHRTDDGGGNATVRHAPAAISIIRENWNLRYSACFLNCPLLKVEGKVKVPQSLSIVAKRKGFKVTNQIEVQHHGGGGRANLTAAKDLGVCVKPMFGYNKTQELIEFIEMNKILGVTGFTFYNRSLSPEVSCVLRHYQQQDQGQEVEVMPWQGLKVDSQTEIRTEGLFAGLNDCLYRNMNRFKYLMLIDLDELIVPHSDNIRTIPEMIHHLNTNKVYTKSGQLLKLPRTGVSSYSFQNAFFYLQFEDDPETPPGKAGASALRVLRKTRRKSKVNPQKQRSKYICVPRNVKEAGNHFVWEFSRGNNVNVPTEVGLLHHYRVCEFGGDDCVRQTNHVDRTVPHKYAEKLQTNVAQKWKALNAKCSNLMSDKPISTTKKNSNPVDGEIHR